MRCHDSAYKYNSSWKYCGVYYQKTKIFMCIIYKLKFIGFVLIRGARYKKVNESVSCNERIFS